MSITLTHGGLPDGLTRAKLLTEIDAAGPKVLNLTATAFRLLKCIILKCRDTDFLKGRICGTWDRPATIAAELGIDRRVLDNAERQLERQGFIARTWTLHAARDGRRRDGRIVFLAGINLAPLIDGFVERVSARRVEASLQRQAVDTLQLEISGLWRQIRARADGDGLAKANVILPGGRKSRISGIERLQVLRDDLEALLAAISEPSGAPIISDRSEHFCAPNILPADSPTSCSGENTPGEPIPITPARALGLASEDYQAVVDVRGGANWPNLIEASAMATAWHGISQRQWGRACQQLGRERAALCVLAIDHNARLPEGHRYRGRSPGACLAGMVRKHRQQGFDPTRLLTAIQGFREDPARSAASPVLDREAASLPGVSRLGSQVEDILQQAARHFTGASR